MSRKKVFYMHTIDGRAAYYSARNRQIVYAEVLPNWQDEFERALLRGSVKEIEEDQRKTRRYRKRRGFKDANATGKYGYVVVEVP